MSLLTCFDYFLSNALRIVHHLMVEGGGIPPFGVFVAMSFSPECATIVELIYLGCYFVVFVLCVVVFDQDKN